MQETSGGTLSSNFGGKQLEGGMEAENLRRNKSENLDVCSELWREKNCQTDAVYNFLSGLPSPRFCKIKFSGVGRGDSRDFSVNIEEEAYRSFVIFKIIF